MEQETWAPAELRPLGSRGPRRGASQPQGPDQHGHLLERVRPAAELRPVDAVLVAAPIVAAPVPYAVEVGVGTGMVPPASPLV